MRKSIRFRRVAALALAVIAGLAIAACGEKKEEAATDETALIGPGGHEINEEEVQEAWETFGQGGIDYATAEPDSAEVEANIIANAYMKYHAEGITKAYDALAYAALFPLEFRDWYKDCFDQGIEDVCMDLEPTFSEPGDFVCEEIEDPAKVYSTTNINEYIEAVSGQRAGALSDDWRDLKRLMEKWTVKHAFDFTYTTTLADGKTACTAEFVVINVGTGWFIDVRDLQGPAVTEK